MGCAGVSRNRFRNSQARGVDGSTALPAGRESCEEAADRGRFHAHRAVDRGGDHQHRRIDRRCAGHSRTCIGERKRRGRIDASAEWRPNELRVGRRVRRIRDESVDSGHALPGSSVGFISPDLDPTLPGAPAVGTGLIKSGYVVDLVGNGALGTPDCNGAPTNTDYVGHGRSSHTRQSGQRGFNTDRAGTIFFDAAGLATGTTPIQ